MANVKHTPGDWGAWQAPDGCWAVRTVYHDERGRRTTAWPAVCNAGAQPNEHNARLIAAAPDMLAALTALTTTLRNCGMTAELMSSVGMYRDEAGNVIHWDMAELVATADAALAKAKGAAS